MGDRPAPSGARRCFNTNTYYPKEGRASKPRISASIVSRRHRRDHHGHGLQSPEVALRLWLRSAFSRSPPLTQQSTVISKLLIPFSNRWRTNSCAYCTKIRQLRCAFNSYQQVNTQHLFRPTQQLDLSVLRDKR